MFTAFNSPRSTSRRIVHSETPHCWATSPKLKEVRSTPVAIFENLLFCARIWLTINCALMQYQHVARKSSTASPAKEDRFLADKQRRIQTEDLRDKYERQLTFIANLEFPDERGEGFTDQEFSDPSKAALVKETWSRLTERLQAELRQTWPEIWVGAETEPPVESIRQMRAYLRRCWDTENKRERDWHIHRAREYYQRTRILQRTQGLRRSMNEAIQAGDARKLSLQDSQLEGMTQELLDQVPARTFLESALFHLQEMAGIKSRRPLRCPTATCAKPYFFSHKKGTRYCLACRTAEARQKSRKKASNRNTWHKNKADYRPKGGSK
jgi:hypothetical protein